MPLTRSARHVVAGIVETENIKVKAYLSAPLMGIELDILIVIFAGAGIGKEIGNSIISSRRSAVW